MASTIVPTQCFLTPVKCQGLGFWLWASMLYIQAYPIIQLSTLLISPWVFNFVSLAPGPQQTLHKYLQTKLNIPKALISQTPKTEYLNFQNKPWGKSVGLSFSNPCSLTLKCLCTVLKARGALSTSLAWAAMDRIRARRLGLCPRPLEGDSKEWIQPWPPHERKFETSVDSKHLL